MKLNLSAQKLSARYYSFWRKFIAGNNPMGSRDILNSKKSSFARSVVSFLRASSTMGMSLKALKLLRRCD